MNQQAISIQQAYDFQEELVRKAKLIDWYEGFDNIWYTPDCAWVYFSHNNRWDTEYETTYLTKELIEMSDEDIKKYVEKRYNDRIKKLEQEKANKIKQDILESERLIKYHTEQLEKLQKLPPN